jgi:hypothetical protein
LSRQTETSAAWICLEERNASAGLINPMTMLPGKSKRDLLLPVDPPTLKASCGVRSRSHTIPKVLRQSTRLFDSMSFKLNHQVLYEETDLLLRYGRCSFELLHGHGFGRRHVPVQFTMSLHLGGDVGDET